MVRPVFHNQCVVAKLFWVLLFFFEKLTAKVYDIMLLNVPSTEKSWGSRLVYIAVNSSTAELMIGTYDEN